MTNNEILKYITESFDLKRQGYYKQAIELLYKALNIENNNVELLSQLADLYFLLKNYERAIQYIEKTLEINPTNLECLNLLKEVYLKQNELLKAKEITEKIIEIKPDGKNLAQYVKILNQLNDFESIEKFETKITEQDENVFIELAEAYYKNHKIEKSINFLEKALEINPKNINTLTFLGKLYYKTNDLYKSKAVFSMIEEKDENDICLNYLGLFAMDESKFSNAINYFQKAIKINQKNPEYYFNLANAYFLNGWIEEAINYFNQAILKSPEIIEYQYALAYLYYSNKNYDKAEYETKKILSKNSEHTQTKILQALIKYQKGDEAGARISLEKLVNVETTDDFAIFSLARLYFDTKLFDKAETLIKQALEIKGENIEYLGAHVQILIEQKKYEEAQKALDKIITKTPKYYEGWILQAELDYTKGDCLVLFDTAQKLIELDSNKAEGYYYNALALYDSEDINFAIESLKKAIYLDVNNSAYYILMSEFYQAIGQNENALLYLGEACNIDENAKTKELYQKLAATMRK